MKKKHFVFFVLFALAVCSAAIPLIKKLLPITLAKESFRSSFDKDIFFTHLTQTGKNLLIAPIF